MAFTLRRYQKVIIARAKETLATESKVAICSACASGKTYMATNIIQDYLKQYPKSRVLVLTHGRTVLRSQFYQELERQKVDVAQYVNGAFPANRVIVALPHIRRKNLPHFDLVIIDEAHHFYLAKMVQTILHKVQMKHLLLLTASASYFVKTQFPRVMFSTQELRENSDALADVTSFIVQTSYDFGDADFTENDMLKTSVEMPLDTTKSSLAMVIWSLMNALRRNVGKHPHLFNGGDGIFEKLHHFVSKGELEKTMIAAATVEQAKQIHSVLADAEIAAFVSTYENDIDFELLDRFKAEDDVKILVVVDRGTVGFDMPQLKNFIDMTGTENPEIIYQMLGRISRNDHLSKPKVFIKASPKARLSRTELVTCFALALTTKAVFESYDGNYMITKFPLPSTQRPNNQKKEKSDRKQYSDDQPKVIALADYTDILNHLKHRDTESAAAVAWVTLNEQFNVFYWARDECLQIALKYKTRIEWMTADPNSYSAARRNGWLDACCTHMPERVVWTKEKCKISASTYRTRKTWHKAQPGAYAAARQNEWLDECCEHMVPVRKPTVLAECLADALKYETRNEWAMRSPRLYKAAHKHGWVPQCCTHMQKINADKFVLEDCRQDAQQYLTRKKWQTASPSRYQAARKNGWLEECCMHMPMPSQGKWTLESCIESAKMCRNRKEWQNKAGGAFKAAKREGWMETCCGYFRK